MHVSDLITKIEAQVQSLGAKVQVRHYEPAGYFEPIFGMGYQNGEDSLDLFVFEVNRVEINKEIGGVFESLMLGPMDELGEDVWPQVQEFIRPILP